MKVKDKNILTIEDLNRSLFGAKEAYEFYCDKNGILPLVNPNLSDYYQKEARYDNLHLLKGLRFSEDNELPIINPYTGPICDQIECFDKITRNTSRDVFIHFFQKDFKWATRLWNNLEKTAYRLKDFKGLFATDFSLFADMPKSYNMQQLFKARVSTAFLQAIGFNVIPVFSYWDAYSLDICLEGLPHNSVIGICGTGLNSHSNLQLWEYAIRTMEEFLNPFLIIVYGPERNIIGLQTPIKFIEDQLTKFHKK